MFATYYNPGAAMTGDATHVGLNGQNRVAEMTGTMIPNTLNVGTIHGVPGTVGYNPYVNPAYPVNPTPFGPVVGMPTVPTMSAFSPFVNAASTVPGWNTTGLPSATIYPTVGPIPTIPQTFAGLPMSPFAFGNPYVGVSPWGLVNPIAQYCASTPATMFGVPFNPMGLGVPPAIHPAMLAMAATLNAIHGMPAFSPFTTTPFVNPISAFNPISTINPFAQVSPYSFPGVSPVSATHPFSPINMPSPFNAINPIHAIGAISPFGTISPMNPLFQSIIAAQGLNAVNPLFGGLSPLSNPLQAIAAQTGVNPITGVPSIASSILSGIPGVNPFAAINPFGTIPTCGVNPGIFNSIGATPFSALNPISSLLGSPITNLLANPLAASTLLNPITRGIWSSAIQPFFGGVTSPWNNPVANLASLPFVNSIVNPFTGLINPSFVNPIQSPINGIVPGLNPFTSTLNPWTIASANTLGACSPWNVNPSLINPWAAINPTSLYGNLGWTGASSPIFGSPVTSLVHPAFCGTACCN